MIFTVSSAHATIILSPLFDRVHLSVYLASVKRRELERWLRKLGWKFLRHGGNHDVWTDGDRQEAIPRHPEINERLARTILKRVQKEK